MIGIHILGNLTGCSTDLLKSVHQIREILLKTVQEADFTSVGEAFHQFPESGVTGVILLSESHISIHTWPEKNLVALDIFSCSGEEHALKGFDILCKYLNPKNIKKKVIRR